MKLPPVASSFVLERGNRLITENDDMPGHSPFRSCSPWLAMWVFHLVNWAIPGKPIGTSGSFGIQEKSRPISGRPGRKSLVL